MRPSVALRLIRSDVARLDDIRQAQVLAMLGGADLQAALEQVTEGLDPEDEALCLVYLRLEDQEGWFLDQRGKGSAKTDLDGGMFFRADTLEPWGLEMSQGTWHQGDADLRELMLKLGPKLRVKVRGAALDAAPPFAISREAAAALRRSASETAAPLELRVLSARRYTENQIRRASQELRWLLMHSLRRKVAVRMSQETLDQPLGVNVLYDFTDMGTGERRGRVRNPRVTFVHPKKGLVHLVLGVEGSDLPRFEGFFWDKELWPSETTALQEGLLFHAGSVEWTGVEVKAKSVKANSPQGEALRAGFEALGRRHSVEVDREDALSVWEEA